MLKERILSLLDQEGPLRVRDFLALALHDPQDGYYARGPAIGATGDFYTASNASLFAPALARFLRAASERLGGARVVELGGGTGQLAAALGMPVIVVEPNAGLAAAQRERGLHVVAGLDELAPEPTVFFANEVLDALPVHRLLATPEGVREGYLLADEDENLYEVPGPLSRPELEGAAKHYAPHLGTPGAAVEVNLDARHLLQGMARAAPRSYALFIDYGGEPSRLYGDGRAGGTLRGYHEHRVTGPYERPGEQDVTADVDFTWIRHLAAEEGYAARGPRSQGALLADLQLLDDLMATLQQGNMSAYMAGKNLLMPGGMGERFQALLLARGAPLEPPLPGFRPEGAW